MNTDMNIYRVNLNSAIQFFNTFKETTYDIDIVTWADLLKIVDVSMNLQIAPKP